MTVYNLHTHLRNDIVSIPSSSGFSKTPQGQYFTAVSYDIQAVVVTQLFSELTHAHSDSTAAASVL